MLNRNEVLAIAEPIIAGLENPNVGSAMKAVMAVLKGKADGNVIKNVVIDLLKKGK